jgi:hypothetical protein
VLRWDARFEDKGKHGEFGHFWKGAYKITTNHGNKAFSLQELNVDLIAGSPLNGRFLNHYVT